MGGGHLYMCVGEGGANSCCYCLPPHAEAGLEYDVILPGMNVSLQMLQQSLGRQVSCKYYWEVSQNTRLAFLCGLASLEQGMLTPRGLKSHRFTHDSSACQPINEPACNKLQGLDCAVSWSYVHFFLSLHKTHSLLANNNNCNKITHIFIITSRATVKGTAGRLLDTSA